MGLSAAVRRGRPPVLGDGRWCCRRRRPAPAGRHPAGRVARRRPRPEPGLPASPSCWSARGFGLSFVALRTLPLFAVQAGRASSLAVVGRPVGRRARRPAAVDRLARARRARRRAGRPRVVGRGAGRPTRRAPGTTGWSSAATVVVGARGRCRLGPPTPVARPRASPVCPGWRSAFSRSARAPRPAGHRSTRADRPGRLVRRAVRGPRPGRRRRSRCGARPVVPVTALMVGIETVTGAVFGHRARRRPDGRRRRSGGGGRLRARPRRRGRRRAVRRRRSRGRRGREAAAEHRGG